MMMVFIQIKVKYSEKFVIRLNIPLIHHNNGWEISSKVTAQTFEGLYTLGKGDKPVLGVAKAFPEKSKDG